MNPAATPDQLIDGLLRSLSAGSLLTTDDIRGAAPSELARWEASLPAPLPPSYRTFLRRCGVDCGGFHARSQWRFSELPELHTTAEAELRQATGNGFEPNELPILFCPGIIVLALSLDPDAITHEPPGWGYAARNRYGRRQHFPDFSTFLITSVTEYHQLPWDPT